MASYHCNFSRVSKNKNQSIEAKYNYISREGSYKKKTGFQYAESVNLPNFAKDNPSLFWECSDIYERKNATVGFELKIALPRELNLEQQKALIRDFIKKELPNAPASFAIHNDEKNHNPHCHLIFSSRMMNPRTMRLSPENFFKRASKNREGRDVGGALKDEELDTKKKIFAFRESVAVITNQHLKENGYTATIDHRSLAEQGLAQEAKTRIPMDIYRTVKQEKLAIAKEEDELEKLKSELAKLEAEKARTATIKPEITNEMRIEAHLNELEFEQQIRQAEYLERVYMDKIFDINDSSAEPSEKEYQMLSTYVEMQNEIERKPITAEQMPPEIREKFEEIQDYMEEAYEHALPLKQILDFRTMKDEMMKNIMPTVFDKYFYEKNIKLTYGVEWKTWQHNVTSELDQHLSRIDTLIDRAYYENPNLTEQQKNAVSKVMRTFGALTFNNENELEAEDFRDVSEFEKTTRGESVRSYTATILRCNPRMYDFFTKFKPEVIFANIKKSIDSIFQKLGNSIMETVTNLAPEQYNEMIKRQQNGNRFRM